VINNSTDNSEKILYEFKNTFQNQYHRIRIEKYDKLNIPEDDRSGRIRNNYIYKHLADLRNYICSQTKTPWLFSVDSDVMLLPHSLEQLLKSQKKCISALIRNGFNYCEEINESAKFKCDRIKPEQYTNCMVRNIYGQLVHVLPSQCNGEILQVSMTGACYLLHLDIFKKCKYEINNQGEDIPFCQQIEAMGETIWCDTSLKLPHCMNLDLLEKYKNGEFKF
jgi:hypothetical protein